MQYTEGEIVREFNQARYKNKQIGILAQLNTCQRKDIIEILERNGVEIPDKYKASREEEYNYGTMVAKEKRPYRMKSKVKEPKKEPEKDPEEELEEEVDDYLKAQAIAQIKAQEETKTYIIPEKQSMYADGQLIYSIDKNQQSDLENKKLNTVDKPKADYYATWLRLELLDRRIQKLERKYKKLKKLYKQLAKFILG